jgi:glycosyltransferase involved in cell wall biosynthesis
MHITGTIITYNEEDHIEACIRSLQQVCNEIVVVDSLSTDNTVAIAERLGAVVVPQKYLGEGKQRNVTEAHCNNDWILALDADERLDEEMIETIRQLPFDDERIGYEFNRKSYVGARWVKGPGFYPDYIVRLYNKKHAGYEPKFGHAGVIAPTVKRVPGHIIHYTYDNISDWIAKINQVSSLDAQGMYQRGKAPSNIKPVTSALSAFFRQFIIRGGMFKGIDGFTITMTSVFRSYIKYLKLNELHELAAAGKNKPES